MRRLRLRKTLPRVVRRSSRSSIIGAGSPIDAPRECGLRLLPSYTIRTHRRPLPDRLRSGAVRSPLRPYAC